LIFLLIVAVFYVAEVLNIALAAECRTIAANCRNRRYVSHIRLPLNVALVTLNVAQFNIPLNGATLQLNVARCKNSCLSRLALVR
jgi:hypothetical protein